jgi:acyl carrier protein
LAPRNAHEEILAAIFSEILGVSPVGVNDNFYDLGGDSVAAMLVSARAHRRGLPVTVAEVLVEGTISRLADKVRSADGSVSSAPRPMATGAADVGGSTSTRKDGSSAITVISQSISDPSVEDVFRLTVIQQGMLFHTLTENSSGMYFEQFIFKLTGPLDEAKYRAAWMRTVECNPILRTSVNWTEFAVPVQVVSREVVVPFNSNDLRPRSLSECEQYLQKFLESDRDDGFDLERAPLFRLALLRFGDSEHCLVLSYHHLLLDAWSLFIIISQVRHFYESGREDASERFKQHAKGFRQYAASLEKSHNAAAEAFWRRYMDGLASDTRLSVRQDMSAGSAKQHAERRLEIPAATYRTLREFSLRHRLTLNTLVQAAWALMVSHRCETTDVVYGITITNRPSHIEHVEDAVGIFINTLPMRIQIPELGAIVAWLKDMQARQIRVRDHEHYSLPMIQRLASVPQRDALFDSLLIFENFPRGKSWESPDGLKVVQERYVGWTNYPLAIEAMPGGELYFQVKFDRTFFTDDEITDVLDSFRGMLQAMSGDCVMFNDLPAIGRKRAARPKVELARSDYEAFRPPDDERTLEAVARAWKTVLEVDEVPLDGNFFDLGGHSLRLFQVRSELVKTLGIDISMVDLFRYPTVRQLASFIEGAAARATVTEPEPAMAARRREYLAKRQRVNDGPRGQNAGADGPSEHV